MSTFDQYGIQYGTGALKPASPEGGVTDPNAVTRRRTTGNAGTFVDGFTGVSPTDPGTDAQAILDQISIQNVGPGEGVFSRREANSFLFKSIGVAGNLTISSNQDGIIITGTGGGSSGPLPDLEDYLVTPANFPSGQRNKYLHTKSDGTGIEFIDLPAQTSMVKTLRLQINSVQKFDADSILEIPAGWTFDSIPSLNIAIKFRIPNGQSIKLVTGWGFTAAGGWRAFPVSQNPNLQYSDTDPTLYTFTMQTLGQAQTEANGFVTLHFMT